MAVNKLDKIGEDRAKAKNKKIQAQLRMDSRRDAMRAELDKDDD